MYRNIDLTLPADTNAHNLWDLIVAAGYCDSLGNVLVTAVKNNEILPDRVSFLTATVTAGSVSFQDRHASGGTTYTAGGSQTWKTSRNSISLKDRFFAGAAGSETFTIDLEAA